jgi:hypothetical protein
MLVIVDIVIALLGIFADYGLQGHLPEALQDYRAAEEEVDFASNPRMWVLIFGGLCVLVLGIVSTIGLLVLWRPARLLYTLTYVLSWPLYLLAGASVMTGAAHMLYDMSSVLAGVIWGLIYFSPLKVHFDRQTELLPA